MFLGRKSDFLPDDWQDNYQSDDFLNSQKSVNPLEAYQQALKLEANFAQSYYDLGNTLYGQGDLKGAIESYRKAIDLQDDFLEAYIRLGDSLSELGDWSEATSVYKQALKIDPNSTSIILKLADIIRPQKTRKI